jgi:hypothetical protein
LAFTTDSLASAIAKLGSGLDRLLEVGLGVALLQALVEPAALGVGLVGLDRGGGDLLELLLLLVGAKRTSDGVSSRFLSRVVSSSTARRARLGIALDALARRSRRPCSGPGRLAWMRMRSPARTKLPTSAVVACA